MQRYKTHDKVQCYMYDKKIDKNLFRLRIRVKKTVREPEMANNPSLDPGETHFKRFEENKGLNFYSLNPLIKQSDPQPPRTQPPLSLNHFLIICPLISPIFPIFK